jgi:hypothetical protein
MTFSGDGIPDVPLCPRHLSNNPRLRGYEPRVDRHALRYPSPPHTLLPEKQKFPPNKCVANEKQKFRLVMLSGLEYQYRHVCT